MTRSTLVLVVAVCLAVPRQGLASTTILDVFANAHSYNNGAGAGLDTGIDVHAGNQWLTDGAATGAGLILQRVVGV